MNELVPVKNELVHVAPEEDTGDSYMSATSVEESGNQSARKIRRLAWIVLGAIFFVLAYYYYNVVEPSEAEPASTKAVAVTVEKEAGNQHDSQFNFVVSAKDNACVSFNDNVVMNVY